MGHPFFQTLSPCPLQTSAAAIRTLSSRLTSPPPPLPPPPNVPHLVDSLLSVQLFLCVCALVATHFIAFLLLISPLIQSHQLHLTAITANCIPLSVSIALRPIPIPPCTRSFCSCWPHLALGNVTATLSVLVRVHSVLVRRGERREVLWQAAHSFCSLQPGLSPATANKVRHQPLSRNAGRGLQMAQSQGATAWQGNAGMQESCKKNGGEARWQAALPCGQRRLG
jgi:hypothetical protein